MRLDWNASPTVIGLMVAALLVAAGAGCSTAISTMQSAETLPKGKWHVGTGMDVSIPASRVGDLLDAAAAVEDRASDPNYVATDEDRKIYADAIIGIVLNAPGVGNDTMVRYGLGAKLDLGARFTTTGIHGDIKWQFLGSNDPSDDGWHASISLGYANHKFEGLIFDVLELLKVDDFSRHDFEAPLIIGKHLGRFGRFWFGPKFIAAKVHVDATLQELDGTLTTDDWVTYIGGFAGIAGGYKGIEAFVEVTVVDMQAKPTIFGEKRDLGGIVIMPAVGVMARF